MSFEEYKKTFEDKNCTLLITLEEFNQIKNKSTHKFNIISSCGHNHSVHYNVFKHRNSGVLCPSCKGKETVEKKKKNNEFDKIDGCSRNTVTEHNGFLMFKEMIKDVYDVKKTLDGSLVDFCIKKKDVIEDKWIPFQIKTSINFNSFHISNKYKDMILLLININAKRYWMMNGNDFLNQCKIEIGVKKSKYSIYEFNNTNVFEFIDKYSVNTIQKTFEEFNTCSAYYIKREQEYAKKREEKLNFLKFEYDEKGYLVYDFIINSYKIQEKVSEAFKDKTNKDSGQIFQLTKRKTDGKKSKFIPYEINDNDFYWFHIFGTSLFYIIPEKKLIEHGYISNQRKTGPSIILYPNRTKEDLVKKNIKTQWANDYLFSYDNESDMEKIKNIFIKDTLINL